LPGGFLTQFDILSDAPVTSRDRIASPAGASTTVHLRLASAAEPRP